MVYNEMVTRILLTWDASAIKHNEADIYWHIYFLFQQVCDEFKLINFPGS